MKILDLRLLDGIRKSLQWRLEKVSELNYAKTNSVHMNKTNGGLRLNLWVPIILLSFMKKQITGQVKYTCISMILQRRNTCKYLLVLNLKGHMLVFSLLENMVLNKSKITLLKEQGIQTQLQAWSSLLVSLFKFSRKTVSAANPSTLRAQKKLISFTENIMDGMMNSDH